MRATAVAAVAAALAFGSASVAAAQERDAAAMPLLLASGRTLHITLDHRTRITGVGQSIAGTVVDSVYIYDRVMIPAGTHAIGRVAAIDPLGKARRTFAALNGDFTPAQAASVVFTTLMLDGRSLPIDAPVTSVVVDLRQINAASPETRPVKGGRAGEAISRAKAEVTRQAHAAIDGVTRPGRLARVRDAVVARLPAHPNYFRQGTVFTAALRSPIDFGMVIPIAAAPDGTTPAPSTLLNARLTSALDSRQTARGAAVSAVLTKPVLSPEGQLILPEGTQLHGTVTQVVPARYFRRNGRLRFLIESVELPGRNVSPLRAALDGVRAGAGERLKIDDEGTVGATNSNLRLAIPALAVMATLSVADPGETDPLEVTPATEHVSMGTQRGMAGYFGLGLAGTALSAISKPVALGIAVFGSARSVYGAVFGRGHEVAFPADTELRLQLAPGPRTPE